ncbi:MAG: cyclase family protein, partial [Nanoarchaeota archaeon]|nr:cyclase family protein [Nanoarchaeota archaeon]
IDLTEPLKLNTEVYPNDPKPERAVFSKITEGGWEHYTEKISDHNFHPHADAPKHQNPDMQDKGIEFFNKPEYVFNSACMIDLSAAPEAKEIGGIKYLVEVEEKHLKPYSETLSDKGAVLIRTGYDRWLEANKPHAPENLPYLNKGAAEFLNSFDKIKVVGIDSLTVDPVGKHDSHQILKNMLIVESLVHLYEIPEKSRTFFDLQTKPVVIEGATGGPVVAYAFIKL